MLELILEITWHFHHDYITNKIKIWSYSPRCIGGILCGESFWILFAGHSGRTDKAKSTVRRNSLFSSKVLNVRCKSLSWS